MIQDSAIFEARETLDIIIGQGVRDVVLSPGSRNAPLLIAAAARNQLKKYVVSDERTAAFVGLGLAAGLNRPVALICTSGTALLNYSPAVAEAYYRQIPLIVISADRPEQWIDQDDSQTIRQFEALRNFVKNSYDIEAGSPGNSERNGLVNRLVNDAMANALSKPQGPVHINIRFPEPLGTIQEQEPYFPRIIEKIESPSSLSREKVRKLCNSLGERKIMVTVGFMNPDHRMIRALHELEQLPNVCIMAESVANYTVSPECSAVDIALGPLPEEKKRDFFPDLVISLGGALISRKLKEFLRVSHAEHWSVGHTRTTVDCFRSLTKRIETDPAPFLLTFASIMRSLLKPATPFYGKQWKELRERAIERRDKLVEAAPWCELKVFSELSRHLTPNFNLHLSNGTSIRYGQLFDFDVHAVYCNRGVSGIDGSTSTAVGGALAYSGPTLLITGDTSFSYDLGGLASGLAPDDMKIIVINNSGGAIFRFVGSTASLDIDIREKYFCADSKVPVRGLALAYGWKYMSAEDKEQFDEMLPVFLNLPERAILDIKLPALTGTSELKKLLSPSK